MTPSGPFLRVEDVVVARNAMKVTASFRASNETIALLGPNGAGKSTVVDALAGVVALDRGLIEVGGKPWDDPASSILVPSHKRKVGVAFQDLRLFDWMTALDNVAYGTRRLSPRSLRRARAREVMDRFGVAHVAEQRAGTLSGGQAQLVALARAFASEPDLLLLDEPLSALDIDKRAAARRALRERLGDFDGVAIIVTHEPVEAYALCDKIVILENGAVTQTGTSADIRRRPRSTYAASLAGLNLFRGRVRRAGEHLVLETDLGAVALPAGALPEGSEAMAALSPRAITLSVERPSGSARNVIPCTVQGIEITGESCRVVLAGAPPLISEITAEAASELQLDRERTVWASFKATQVECYPA